MPFKGNEPMTTIQTRPYDWFNPDPTQPRKWFDPEEIDRLGADMESRGVLMPLLARAEGNHGIIIDGGRRWLAAGRKKIKELPVIIYEKTHTASEIKGIQLATAIHRAELSDYERYAACTELLKLNPGWSYVDLAKFLNMNPPAITKLMSVAKCSVEWQEAFAAGRVGVTEMYAVSSQPETIQAELLNEKLAGASRDELVRSAKRHSDVDKPSVKLTRIKYILPSSGVSIITSGAELSLDDYIDALGEAQKEARKARDHGGDIKSFQAVNVAKNKKHSD